MWKERKFRKSTSCLIDYICCPKESKEKKICRYFVSEKPLLWSFSVLFFSPLFAFISDGFGNCCLHAFRPFRGHLRSGGPQHSIVSLTDRRPPVKARRGQHAEAEAGREGEGGERDEWLQQGGGQKRRRVAAFVCRPNMVTAVVV